KDYSSLDASTIERFPAAVIGEVVLNFLFLVFVIYTAVLFFRTSKAFRKFFVLEVFLGVLLIPIDAVWVAFAMSAATDQPFGPLLQSVLDPKDIAKAGVHGIVGSIWILYLFKSRRVANTFVH